MRAITIVTEIKLTHTHTHTPQKHKKHIGTPMVIFAVLTVF